MAFGTSAAATTSNTYDNAGRLTAVEDGVHNVTHFGYNAKGERTSMTDAKNRTTNYTYDERGRQLKTITPDNKEVVRTYDGLGLVLTTKDEELGTTTFEYDAASQLKPTLPSAACVCFVFWIASSPSEEQRIRSDNVLNASIIFLSRRIGALERVRMRPRADEELSDSRSHP